MNLRGVHEARQRLETVESRSPIVLPLDGPPCLVIQTLQTDSP